MALRSFYNNIQVDRLVGLSISYKYDGGNDVEGRKITSNVLRGAKLRSALFW